MIPLKDIFSLLASGEFSNIAISKDSKGNINETEYGKIIGHINLALVEIYKRFKFMEDEIVLHADPSVKIYYLRPEYMAAPGSTTTSRYIERPLGSDGFINIIEIKDIFDEQEKRIGLNNRFSIPSIKQVAGNTLKITGLNKAQPFSVVFQSHPSPIILNDNFNVNTHKIDIPSTIIEPLLYYVATRVYKPMGANNSTETADKSSSYQQKYELSCQKLEHYGLDIDDNDRNENKFTNQGWA